MTERTNEEIILAIKEAIADYVQPAVADHGGQINFLDYNEGTVELLLGGACSGCAGSMYTLKQGVEGMLMHFVPEVKNVIAQDDPNSVVDPFYQHDPFMYQDFYFDNDEA
jgi:Fe-S cluster biogenesis protein NfuA